MCAPKVEIEKKRRRMKMRGQKKVLTLAIASVLALGTMAACSTQEGAGDASPGDEGKATQEQARALTPQEDMLESQGVKIIHSEHSGIVQQLEDGTQIMPAPYFVKEKGMFGQHYNSGEGSDGGEASERNGELTIAGTGFSTVDYNVDVLHADERGCNACHVSLLDALNEFDPEHSGLSAGDAWLDVKAMKVDTCIACHTVEWDMAQSEPDFGEMIHTLHGTVAGEEKATCFQCHSTDKRGFDQERYPEYAGSKNMLGQEFTYEPSRWVLWEDVKYDQMKGIANIANAQGDFSYSQDEITPRNQLFNETWLAYSSAEMAEVVGVNPNGLEGDFKSIDEEKNQKLKDEIFDNWDFGIKGCVNNPQQWKLKDLIQQATDAGVVKTVAMKEHCGITKLGGWQIGQVEVTGVPVSWLVEQAGGYTSDAKWIDGESLDSSEIDGLNMGLFIGSTPIDWEETKGYDVMVVWEINGERLDWANGFPLQLWIGGAAADAYMKQLVNVDITNDETRMGTDTTEKAMCMGPIQFPGYGGVKANAGIMNTYDGQVVEAGKPYTFHGYLDGWYEKCGGIKVSMDGGQTWTVYETPDVDAQRWVTWDFTWQVPEGNAAYVLDVKPFLTDGSETIDSLSVMINAVEGGVVENAGDK